MLRRYSFFIVLVLFPLFCLAQDGRIQGKVLGQSGKALPAAHIYIDQLGKGTTSNEAGIFTFDRLKPGLYTISVSSVGFERAELAVTVGNGIVHVDFLLKEKIYTLDDVTISDTRTLNEQVPSLGKAGIRAFDLPQSTVTISKEILQQQQVLRLSDAIKNVNGLYVMGTTGGNQEELAGRGFAYNSNNTFKNGSRFNNSVFPEMSSLEKVEVLKGSNAILFGNVAPGGIINLITKKPRFENGGEISLRAASFDFYKPSVDVYGPVSQNTAYRLNTTFEKGNSFRESVSSKRFYINPSILQRIGSRTEVIIEADYLDDHRTSDYGTGAIDYVIARVPRSTFLGARWSYADAIQKSATASIQHLFNDKWKIKGLAALQDFRSDLFGTTRPNANSQFIKSDGTWIRGLQRSESKEDYFLTQIDITGNFSTRGISHTLLIGADRDGYHTTTLAYNNMARYDTINIFSVDANTQRADIPSLTKRTLTKSPTQRSGIYLQDFITLSSKIKLLTGVRYTYMKRTTDVFTYASNNSGTSVVTDFRDDALTPRFGAVYQPLPFISLFASYANSFILNSGIDINSNPLPPSFINQYEAGIKNEFFNGLISANLTAYQIVNSNLAQTVIIPAGNPNNVPVNAQELAGEVTSRGMEIDLMTRAYFGLSIVGGYSFNETRYTKSNIYEIGSKLRYNPQHTANLSLWYAFPGSSVLKHVNCGVSFFYTGNRVAGRSTRLTVANDSFRLMTIPDFVQTNFSMSYVRDKFSLRAGVNNVFDVLSYYVHDDNSVNPIAPRIFSTTLSIRL